MSENELRIDPFTGEIVFVSAERGKRPSDFTKKREKTSHKKIDKKCFFCPGNEHFTPPTIDSIGRPWKIRVFENKFPAVSTHKDPSLTRELLRRGPAYGHHEVIVETNEHWKHPQDFTENEIGNLLKMYQRRERFQYNDPKIKSAIIFRNHLAGGGASIAHAHSQIVSLPWVHPRLAKEESAYKKYERKTGRCIYCDTLESEGQEGDVIAKTKHYTVIAPFASKWAFQTMIIPNNHEPFFGEASLFDFKKVLSKLLKSYDKLLKNPPYNYFIHSSPKSFHWHAEVWPALQTPAGLEKGADIFINTVSPKDAAKALKTKWDK